MSEQIKTVPYELLAEHAATAEAASLAKQFGSDPGRIVRNLPDILKAIMLDGINIGLGLADMHEEVSQPEDTVAEYMAAYLEGYNDSKENGVN